MAVLRHPARRAGPASPPRLHAPGRGWVRRLPPAAGRAGPLVAVALVVAAVGAGCGSGRPAAGAPSTTSAPPPAASPAPATTAPTSPPTTGPWTAQSAQPSPDAAAALAVDYWSKGDRAGAARVAAPPAVSALFAIAYPAGMLQARGCTDATTSPGTCTYRNLQTDAIYEFAVTRGPSGWFVSGVNAES